MDKLQTDIPTLPIVPISPNPVETPEKNNNPILIIGLVILVFTLGAGGVLAYQKMVQTTTITRPNTPTPTKAVATPTQTTSQVPADWKSYQSYGFSIRYPNDWSEEKITAGNPVFIGPNKIDSISFSVLPKGGQSGNDNFDNYCQTRTKAVRQRTEKQFTLYDNPAIYCFDGNDPKQYLIYFMTQKDNKQYEAIGSFAKGDNLGKSSQNFSIIISSFRIIESSQPEDTADWKTYTSTTIYKYQVEYPASWKIVKGDLYNFVRFVNPQSTEFIQINCPRGSGKAETELPNPKDWEEDGPGLKELYLSTDKINNMKAVQYVWGTDTPGTGTKSLYTSLLSNTNPLVCEILTIETFNNIDYKNEISKLEIYNHVLSTFQFTD
jgi:hypothetical protein